MNKINYVPLGSVVLLNGGSQRMLIIARGLNVENEGSTYFFDYGGVPYPNGLTASWTYDANNQLLQVCNATTTNTISQYDYAYDAAGRRINMSKSGSVFDQGDTVSYGYNNRSELTNAVASVDAAYRYAYDFDDIGNRETAAERGTNTTYAANSLNQYTSISNSLSTFQPSTFQPVFDDDGNQTLIKTATGIWSVAYNGENRPILWTCIQSNNQTLTNNQTISMSFDRMGRRVTKNAQRFVYDGYLQIVNFEQSVTNSQLTTHSLQLFIWDPTEPVATRPLVWNSSTIQPFNFSTSYYTHDGNKNVSEVMAIDAATLAHYDCAPFGAVTSAGSLANINHFRFSSEYVEDDLGLVYYNHRHYNPIEGRWLSRDPIAENGGIGLYAWCHNGVAFDFLGKVEVQEGKILLNPHDVQRRIPLPGPLYRIETHREYDTYEYRLTYEKSCDNFNHAYLWVTGVSGDYLDTIDDLGIDVGWKFISIGVAREYTVEWVSDPPQGNEDATCVNVSVRIYVYKIIGMTIGGNFVVGKNGNVGTSVGPFSGKTQIGYGKVILPEHCCCDEKKTGTQSF